MLFRNDCPFGVCKREKYLCNLLRNDCVSAARWWQRSKTRCSVRMRTYDQSMWRKAAWGDQDRFSLERRSKRTRRRRYSDLVCALPADRLTRLLFDRVSGGRSETTVKFISDSCRVDEESDVVTGYVSLWSQWENRLRQWLLLLH